MYWARWSTTGGALTACAGLASADVVGMPAAQADNGDTHITVYGGNQSAYFKTGDPALINRGRETRHAPRSGVRMKSRMVIAAAAVLALAGCGSNGKDTNSPTATAGTSGAQVQIGNTVNYGSFGTTADIDCADGKSLNVGGSNNTLTVTGTCASVNIGGADNKITFEKINDKLSVVGLNNTITYKDGDPKIENLGSGNDIKQG